MRKPFFVVNVKSHGKTQLFAVKRERPASRSFDKVCVHPSIYQCANTGLLIQGGAGVDNRCSYSERAVSFYWRSGSTHYVPLDIGSRKYRLPGRTDPNTSSGQIFCFPEIHCRSRSESTHRLRPNRRHIKTFEKSIDCSVRLIYLCRCASDLWPIHDAGHTQVGQRAAGTSQVFFSPCQFQCHGIDDERAIRPR